MTLKAADMSLYQMLNVSTWRVRFLEAAERAARRVFEYSRNRGDYENAARWKERELSIREQVRRTKMNAPRNE